ncbi:MAG: fused MFS/spermidine synthase [Deltaproteobacteria bacterium]|jgi:spermidine synthase|nr:fused MFS/spermidine synthase [Deltaproteobacteria bacterium]
MRPLIDSFFTRKYGGKLIYETSDGFGPLQVVDDQNIRSLHFGSRPKQSSLDLLHPNRLYLEYSKHMMTALMFKPNPQSCMVLGLGGGSISRFLFHHYPDIDLTSVELRQKVINIAHRFFDLPESGSFKIKNNSAENFVETNLKAKYDLIFTDIFNQHGMAKTLLSIQFMKGLKRKLNKNGVLAINLWLRPEKLFDQIITIMNTYFSKRIILVPILHRTNCIVIAINSENLGFSESLMLDTAIQLKKKMGINFGQLSQIVAEYNSSFLI